VKILFDINTPAPLARWLRGHEVKFGVDLGWKGLENGKLLDAAEESGFDLMITCDQNIPYQQNFTGRKIAVVVLSSNRWPLIRPAAARIATLVDFVQCGQVTRIQVQEQRN
jgi:hypothetical protein